MSRKMLLPAVGLAALILSATWGADTLPPVSSGLTSSGRYQIVLNPNVRADTFLLDTWTGDTWIWVMDPLTHEQFWSQLRKMGLPAR